MQYALSFHFVDIVTSKPRGVCFARRRTTTQIHNKSWTSNNACVGVCVSVCVYLDWKERYKEKTGRRGISVAFASRLYINTTKCHMSRLYVYISVCVWHVIYVRNLDRRCRDLPRIILVKHRRFPRYEKILKIFKCPMAFIDGKSFSKTQRP